MTRPTLDLRRMPWSVPGSRLYLLDGGRGLCLHSAEYERSPASTTLLEDLRVTDADGRALPVTGARPDRIELADGAATITFAGAESLSIGSADGAPVRLDARHGQLPVDVHAAEVTRDGDGWDAVGPEIAVGVGGPPRQRHAQNLADTAALTEGWAARCPQVREDLAPMAALCWWVLGANTVRLRSREQPAVVPSLTGYVGLWQWDAYFIARGLRHGDLGLACAQLDLALGEARPDGQLPDVVHDDGVLASSDNLPPGDLARLRELGSPAADPSVPVPLTKPPLTAWAVLALAEAGADEGWVVASLGRALASQRWWYAASDTDGDGVPEYGHPYSSGLDDSPVFDAVLPLVSPDLLAYLVLQDDLLADAAYARGDEQVAAECRERARRTRAALQRLWHGDRFLAGSSTGPVEVDAITGLLPVLVPGLPEAQVDALVAAIEDADRYGTPFGLPTVAVSDPTFDRARMWRGPTWISTNALVIDGLRRAGRDTAATELTERTLATVITAGGPYEYVDPLTATPAPRAVGCFGWSAALFVDLAVAVSSEPGARGTGRR